MGYPPLWYGMLYHTIPDWMKIWIDSGAVSSRKADYLICR